MKLFDSELKIMDIIWDSGEAGAPAKMIAQILREKYGWTKATTYTLIRRCIAKGAVERIEPNFQCRALIPKEEIQESETQELVDKLFNGVPDQLIASLLGKKENLTKEKAEKLLKMIQDLDEND